MCVLYNDIRVMNNIYSGPFNTITEESVHSHCVSGQTAQFLTFPPMHVIQELAALNTIKIYYLL